MLSFTRKTDYALVALARLAEARKAEPADGVLSARRISEQYGIPLSVLMNIMKDLVKGGLIHSARGSRGGYSLAVAPSQISVARVVESLEGPLKFAPCCGDDEVEACRDCKITPRCPITDSIRSLNEQINGSLNRVTLADLVAGHVAIS